MIRTSAVAWAELPEEADTLFGADFFSTRSWYETVLRTGLPPGASGVFVLVEHAGRLAGIVPMQRRGKTLSSLTTPYTCLWQVLPAAGSDGEAVGEGLGRFCRGRHVRLDALDLAAASWPALRAGLRRNGIRTLPFDHFGNWVFPHAQAGWDAYLAARPGNVREVLRRRGARLEAAGAEFRVVENGHALEWGIAAYEAMHASSWKAAEPFPDFNAMLMRACAGEGSLRLGVLSLDGRVLAAQFWVVFGGTATMLKLAHDQAENAWSPGTVLTGWMIRHLLTRETIDTIDFGRGDDAYKQLWMSERRQRQGLILASPRHVAGCLEIMRHALRTVMRGSNGGRV